MKTPHPLLPPGPRGWPVLGSLPEIIRRPLDFYRELTHDYGPISCAKVGPAKLYFVNDPVLIDNWLVDHKDDCVKDVLTRSLIPLVGYGLLTSEGELWRRQRKLAAQPFTPKRLAPHDAVMVDSSERMFARFVGGEQRDFHRDAMTLTLDIVCRTLLGELSEHESTRIGHIIDEVLAYFEERVASWGRLLPPSVPTPRQRRFHRAKRELDQIVRAIIARARAQNDESADNLLARLMRARDDDGSGMTEQQLLDETCTILLAGHETTALTLMYAVYSLSRDPLAAARLRAEIDRELGGRRASSADLPRLPYLDAVVRETLRLYPSAYAFAREAAVDFELGGYLIPRGSQIVTSPYAMHRHPSWFREPERFDPERWLRPDANQLPRYVYIPFGAGHRVCIGQHFAMLEATLVLATLVQQLELHVPDAFKIDLSPVVTLRARGGLPVRVQRRASTTSSGALSCRGEASLAHDDRRQT